MLRLRPPALGISVVSIALLTSPSAHSQDTRRAPELKVFSVAGARTRPSPASPDMSMMAGATPEPGIRPPRRPAPADAARADAVRALGGGGGRPQAAGNVAAPKPGELQDVTLTAQRPWINEQAYVAYTLAFSVDAQSGVVNFNKSFPGIASVYLNALEGKSYLVDFVVDSWGPGTYRIKSGDVTQEFKDLDGPQHLMAGVQATASGWVHLRLQRMDGSGYYLQEIRVTRVN